MTMQPKFWSARYKIIINEHGNLYEVMYKPFWFWPIWRAFSPVPFDTIENARHYCAIHYYGISRRGTEVARFSSDELK
jgi:hypothetical protein